MPKPSVVAKPRSATKAATNARRRCGLCGKAGKLAKTDCCGEWICDGQDNYVMFSYAKTSCARNHERYTLCGFHFNEGHRGKWQDCKKCRTEFETEMYVYYGTNEHNFEKLIDPPPFEPTRCSTCNRVIKLGTQGHSISGKKYTCSDCFSL